MPALLNRMPAVLMDRDGTLIREVGYLSRPEQIEILPRVPEAIQSLRKNGIKVAVITNQSAVARGYLSEENLQEIHNELRRRLASRGAFLNGIYYCPHHPTEGTNPYRTLCDCRKPSVGLAKQAAAELNFDFGRSYVVGDQSTDMVLAARIGAKGVLLKSQVGRNEQGAESIVMTAKDLWEAAQWIIHDLQGKR